MSTITKALGNYRSGPNNCGTTTCKKMPSDPALLDRVTNAYDTMTQANSLPEKRNKASAWVKPVAYTALAIAGLAVTNFVVSRFGIFSSPVSSSATTTPSISSVDTAMPWKDWRAQFLSEAEREVVTFQTTLNSAQQAAGSGPSIQEAIDINRRQANAFNRFANWQEKVAGEAERMAPLILAALTEQCTKLDSSALLPVTVDCSEDLSPSQLERLLEKDPTVIVPLSGEWEDRFANRCSELTGVKEALQCPKNAMDPMCPKHAFARLMTTNESFSQWSGEAKAGNLGTIQKGYREWQRTHHSDLTKKTHSKEESKEAQAFQTLKDWAKRQQFLSI